MRCYGLLGKRFKKVISEASSLYMVVLIYIYNSQPLYFPTVFADFQAAFFIRTHVNFSKTIEYTCRGIKIYCKEVKTLHFAQQ